MADDDWRKLLKFRCTGCGNCCRRTVVMITDDDIRRITEGTGARPGEFVRFVSQEEAAVPKREPWWVKIDTGPVLMALRHRRGGACIFLDWDNQCTIYEHRPVTCREHPMEVTLSDTGAVECLAISRIVDCPHDWDGTVTRRELRAVVGWNERQSDAFLAKIVAWNRKRKGRKDRPAFLRHLGLDE